MKADDAREVERRAAVAVVSARAAFWREFERHFGDEELRDAGLHARMRFEHATRVAAKSRLRGATL